MDMWEPYANSVRAHLDDAAEKIVFDRYHIMSHMGKGVGTVPGCQGEDAQRTAGCGPLTVPLRVPPAPQHGALVQRVLAIPVKKAEHAVPTKEKARVAELERPLPKQRTLAPRPRWTSWQHRPTSSETRRPVWRARRAWSRRPSRVERSGPRAGRRLRLGRGKTPRQGAGPRLPRPYCPVAQRFGLDAELVTGLPPARRARAGATQRDRRFGTRCEEEAAARAKWTLPSCVSRARREREMASGTGARWQVQKKRRSATVL